MIFDLSDMEARALLRESRIARLGCVVDGYPYVVPVNYIFDGDACAYSHSLHGTKIAALRADPRVCLQVDDIDDYCHWRSVMAFGIYEEITTPSERAHILNQFLARFSMLTPVESAIVRDAEPPAVIVYRIRIERITGVTER